MDERIYFSELHLLRALPPAGPVARALFLGQAVAPGRDRGRVAEQGSREELVPGGGMRSSLASLQRRLRGG